jgi:hypothetical protein
MKLGRLRRIWSAETDDGKKPRRKRTGLRQRTADAVLERTDAVIESTQNVVNRALETIARMRNGR